MLECMNSVLNNAMFFPCHLTPLQVDLFVVKATDIGDIERVIMSHDDSGAGSAWHLQQVDVFSPATQRTYNFPCNTWLEKTSELGMAGCRKELVRGEWAPTIYPLYTITYTGIYIHQNIKSCGALRRELACWMWAAGGA